MHFTGLLVAVAVIALANFATRALTFLFFSSREPPEMLPVIEENLPPMILLLPVIYCLKDMQWLSAQYGISELFTMGVVAGLHFWKRNAMLSIFTGTGLYMVLLQFNVFS
jgi:branched-subunit amino acid transport protein AzlD